MTANAQKFLSIGLGLLFALSAAVAFFVMFKAGCAGDPKGGSLGDPVRALELEGVGLFPLGASKNLDSPALGKITSS